ncbi:ACP5 [Symbiodinium microadriaticum]|nr:ACP5 [Symbiodinium microadriaticum]
MEGTRSLHSSAVLRRWGHLPFFKQYFINGFVSREIQTCDHHSGKTEQKLVGDAWKAQPKVAAHLDLRCKVGSFHCRGHGWPMLLAEMLSEALHQACSIAKDDIVITCVQLRAASQQRSGLVSGFLEATEKLELEAKVASDSSDDEKGDGCRRGLSDILSETPLASYTVEMEVILHDARDASQELKRVATSLRRFHSQAVRRKFGTLPFFREFDFDIGIQLFRSSSCHLGSSNKPLEEHMRPCRRISASPLIHQYSPVVLAGPSVQSQVDILDDFIVFDGYTNIVQRGRAPLEYGPPVAEQQIRAWFLEALDFHLKEENLEVSSIPDASGTALAIRPPDREPLHFDGLWLRVTGVRSRSAQTEKLQKRTLKPSEAGAEAARVASGFLAYAIDFEVRRLGPGLGDDSSAVPNGRYVALADQVRAVLHGCLLHLHRMPTLKKKLKFYRHFEFDHGIQLDLIRHQESRSIGEQTHCEPCEAGLSADATKFSSTPRTFTVGVRFHSAGCTEATAKPTTSAVKISMAALLGLEPCQMEIASVEMKATWCEAELQIRTLTHAPAVAETEALGTKLASLHQNGICSTSCQQLGSWKPVAVVAPALDEDAQPELAVAIQLQLLPPSNSVAPLGEREQQQLKAELERKTGFSRQLRMTSLRQSSGSAILDFAIIGLRKERAGLLKAFWDAALDHSTSVTEQWSGRVVDVKMVEAAQLRSSCPTGSLRSFASETSAISATLGLREAIKDYIHLCRTGGAGSLERQVGLLKHILEILNKIEIPAGVASPCVVQHKHHLAKHGVAASLLQSFSSVLLEVVERHGTLGHQEERAIKGYFLSQDWRPEEMRYALRALTWVLADDTSKAGKGCAHVRPGSRSTLQAALLDRAAGLAEVIRIYQRFLASLHEEDLLCGIYRPCSVLQNLLLALQGIQSKPCAATLHAWLAGTDFLERLGRMLEAGRYRMAYGHAVALVFQVATQMTCKAYIARMDLEPKHSAIICENVNKLMKVMQMWSNMNRPNPSGTWSKSLQEAMDTSLPEFVDLLEQLLPAAHAPSPVDKLKEWTRTESDNINVILGLRSSPPPRPMPSFCKCEV